MNRREFLVGGAAATVAVAAVGVVAYTVRVEPHWLEIVQRELPVAHLPPELQGKTLAQLSDIHIGPDVSDEYVIQSFDRLRALSPDIVVVTGDFLTHDLTRGESQFTQLRSVLAHLPHGRLATVGILGNHDYGRGWAQPDVANRVVKEANDAGIEILRNEVRTVGGLDIIGVDDLWAKHADTTRALADRRSAAAIALCHNPDGLDSLPWADYAGWVLAGHTHGGQCKPPFLPPPMLPVANRRYVAGEVVVNSQRTLYISRGVGHLVQARFNVRPEITLFTLRSV
jgi:predicted MPP superfamily phosphohydrolase